MRSRRLIAACRVCLALGIDDPMQWLHESPPEKVALWEAYFTIEPFGNSWQLAAVQSAQLDWLRGAVLASKGHKTKLREIKDFMPSTWIGAKQKPKNTIASFKSWAASKFGKNVNHS